MIARITHVWPLGSNSSLGAMLPGCSATPPCVVPLQLAAHFYKKGFNEGVDSCLATLDIPTVASLQRQFQQGVNSTALSAQQPMPQDANDSQGQGLQGAQCQQHKRARCNVSSTTGSNPTHFRYWADNAWKEYSSEDQRLLARGWGVVLELGQPTVVTLPDPHDWIRQVTLGVLAEDPDGHREVVGFETRWPRHGQHIIHMRRWVIADGLDDVHIPIGYMNLWLRCDRRPQSA